jgi:hypothetical protein
MFNILKHQNLEILIKELIRIMFILLENNIFVIRK